MLEIYAKTMNLPRNDHIMERPHFGTWAIDDVVMNELNLLHNGAIQTSDRVGRYRRSRLLS